MSRCTAVVGAAVILLAALSWSGSGRAAGPNDYPEWILPSCDAALDEVASAFQEKESRFWNSNLQIVNFSEVRETAFRPWSANVATRRFCRAKAQVSDGVWHPVYFSLVYGMGEVGATWDVQWCVVGLDRNWANNPSCRMAQP